MPTADLPTVDFTPFCCDDGAVIGDPPTAGQQDVATAIDRACRDHGFLQLTNFGVSSAEIHAAFDCSTELFGLSDAAKAGLATQTPENNLGFQPLASETTGGGKREADLKEGFEVGYPGVRPNDFRGCPKDFEPVATELFCRVNRAARRYTMACELALGVEPGFFLRNFAEHPGPDLCTMKFLHYPPCESTSVVEAADATNALRIAEHTDWGMFTFLLLRDGAMGLQIRPVDFGEFYSSPAASTPNGDAGWLDCFVPPQTSQGGSALVNTGALMARWTNDTWRATAHRVVVPTSDHARQHRYSIAAFFDPDSVRLPSTYCISE